MGVDSGKDAPEPCMAKKNAGMVEEGGDKVVVMGGDDCKERGKDKGWRNEKKNSYEYHNVSSFQQTMNPNL